MTTNDIRVIIADDHPVVRAGLNTTLSQAEQLTIVGTACSFEELVQLCARVPADVVILDLLGMGGSPLALLHRLRREHPQLTVLVFSTRLDFAPELLQAGVRGYVTKEELISELVGAIRAVARGEVFLSPLVRAYLEQSQPNTPLSAKELEALKLLAQGLGTIAIAEQMGIDPRTAQNYITTLRRKTGCAQRTQLVDWYRRVYGVGAS